MSFGIYLFLMDNTFYLVTKNRFLTPCRVHTVGMRAYSALDALRPAPLTPCALRPAPCALRPAPCALRPAPCALRNYVSKRRFVKA
jgi:hypothetical protein